MITLQAPRKTRAFHRSAWSSDLTPEVPVKKVKISLTAEHVQAATWSLYNNPVSVAIRPHLSENAAVSMIWNSDSYGPRHAGDEAQIGIHIEAHDPETGRFIEERDYYLKLPKRAQQALWKLRCQGLHFFQPITMTLELPAAALR